MGTSAASAFERSLVTLLTRLETPSVTQSAVEDAGQRCAVAFERLRSTSAQELAGPERAALERARRTLALLSHVGSEQLVDLEQRLQLVRRVRRSLASQRQPRTGDACDVQG